MIIYSLSAALVYNIGFGGGTNVGGRKVGRLIAFVIKAILF